MAVDNESESFSISPPLLSLDDTLQDVDGEEQIQQRPEYRLLWAILENGIADYTKYYGSSGRRGKRLFREVEQWIMQDDATWLCSFVNICLVLGVEPDWLRAKLRLWKEQQGQQPMREAA